MTCFEFGKHASQKQDYYNAINWFEEALNLVKYEGPFPSVKKTLILESLADVYSKVFFIFSQFFL